MLAQQRAAVRGRNFREALELLRAADALSLAEAAAHQRAHQLRAGQALEARTPCPPHFRQGSHELGTGISIVLLLTALPRGILFEDLAAAASANLLEYRDHENKTRVQTKGKHATAVAAQWHSLRAYRAAWPCRSWRSARRWRRRWRGARRRRRAARSRARAL